MSNTNEFLAALHEDLQFFIEWSFGVLHPGTPYMDNWHIQAMTHALTKCARGETRRLLINIPPRYLKSHCVSICLVAWMLGRDPSLKFMCVSYGEALAKELAEGCEKLMRHEEFQAAFPKFKFSDSSPTLNLKTTLGGQRMGTSVGASGTGMGCDIMIVDDITKASASVNERLAAVEFFQGTLLSRIDAKAEGVIIVVGQRIARDDLPGFLIDQGGWDHLNLPVKAWKSGQIALGPHRRFQREVGSFLHPERESQVTLDELRTAMGAKNFDAQYLQRPGAPDGAIINPAWFRRYTAPRPLHEYEGRVLVLDAATSDSSTSDFSVCSVFGVRPEAVDLLLVWRKRVVFDDLQAGIEQLILDYKATHLFIEAEAAGKALSSVLGRQYKQGIHWCHPRGRSKEERVTLAMPYLQQRKIRVPRAAPWISTWEGEVLSFPSVAFDDQTDTLAYFALYPGACGLGRYAPLSREQRDHCFWIGGPQRLVRYS